MTKWKTQHQIEAEEERIELLHCVSRLFHAGMIGAVESRVLRRRIVTHDVDKKAKQRTTEGVLDR